MLFTKPVYNGILGATCFFFESVLHCCLYGLFCCWVPVNNPEEWNKRLIVAECYCLFRINL